MKEFDVYQIGYYKGGDKGTYRLYCKEKLTIIDTGGKFLLQKVDKIL